MQEPQFLMCVDALGSGACGLRVDGTVDAISAGFSDLTGSGDSAIGKKINDVLEALPPLDAIPQNAGGDELVFRQIGADGVARELTPVLLTRPTSAEIKAGSWLVLLDRSGEARLRRRQAQLGRKLDDLRAELEARQRAPMQPGVLPMRELAARLDEAVRRAGRYEHAVTVLRVGFDVTAGRDAEPDHGTELLGCIRAVDEVGAVGEQQYAVVLPHTDLAGGKIVAERIQGRLTGVGCSSVGVGVAQLQREEEAANLVARAEDACHQASTKGGGVLMAVDVM